MGSNPADHSLDDIARRIAGPNHADDIAQEVRIAILRRPPTGNARAWVVAVTRNMLRQVRRAEARRRRREREAARPEALPAATDRSDVRHAVRQLPEPYRSTIWMRYFDGLSSAEIARRQAVPPSTTRNRLRRAVLLLRAMLCLPLALLARPRRFAAGCVITCGCLAYAGDDACPRPIGAPAIPIVSPPSPPSPPGTETPEASPTSRTPATGSTGSDAPVIQV